MSPAFHRYIGIDYSGAHHLAQAKAVKTPVDHAFGMLKDVVQGDRTKWSIVYDINNLKAFYRTATNAKTRVVDLKDTDFSCTAPVQMVDIDAGSGNVSKSFQAYTQQANRKLLGDAFGKTDFLKTIPTQTIDAIAAYPDSFKCEQ
ncbi:hypothetical protein KP004_05655 [Geomonas oryzisoli]|uniref:Uncharacterized protein n=1 Tax=Geomonas oryzisoli TaxID=2847992 RepID=A0ABX8JAN8_9BACT|nr:hypothetical protein [Geomonas oryzisoli]QWV94664.1 hypothetical protein KP004_05655 [Geomonas oryzisoli]